MQCLRDIFTDDKAATQRFPESRSFQERSGGCAVRSGLRVCDGDASPVIAPQSLAAVVHLPRPQHESAERIGKSRIGDGRPRVFEALRSLGIRSQQYVERCAIHYLRIELAR